MPPPERFRLSRRAALVGAHYADPTIARYRSAYFGGNAARLAEVRRTYDPGGFFTQPQDF